MFRSFNLDDGEVGAGADANDPNVGSGGLQRRLSSPRGGLSSLRPSRSRRLRSPRGELRGGGLAVTAKPRHGRRARNPHGRASGNPGGSHSAHRTATHPDGLSGGLQPPHAAHPIPEELLRRIYECSRALVDPVTGHTFGYGFGTVFALGHHPQASGKAKTHPTPHHGHTRRGTLVAYNAGTNTATVRFGDIPDSPTLNVPVSPMISATLMGSATMAAVHLWDAADPTDALITAVL